MFKIDNFSRPSLKILDALYQYDDFMESIKTVVDLGCGNGLDLEWWASATTRDDNPQPLNITCVGVDKLDRLVVAQQYKNITYQPTDFETIIHPPKNLFDILWCHDSFQFCTQPINTLAKWKDIASDGAMLVIAIPLTYGIRRNRFVNHLPSGVYYNHSLASLIYMLATTGWDCAAGFFQQPAGDPWIRAVVYKSSSPALDPKTTTWYTLLETGLLPESAIKSIKAHGYLQQEDLVVPWLDKSLSVIGNQ